MAGRFVRFVKKWGRFVRPPKGRFVTGSYRPGDASSGDAPFADEWKGYQHDYSHPKDQVFLVGSVADPDCFCPHPEPGLNKCAANLLRNIFLLDDVLQNVFMKKKVKYHGFLQHLCQ
jgi:hypothetical protein